MTPRSKKIDAAIEAVETTTSNEQVSWQPLTNLPLIAHFIDDALDELSEQLARFTEARSKPHVLDDAIIDRNKRVYRKQLEFVEIHAEQLRRWRTENPSAAQRQELDRLETQNSRVRQMTKEILVLADELRKGTINRIMEKSDAELGLEFLLRNCRDTK